jgi:ketosteroid isomerase-like protein
MARDKEERNIRYVRDLYAATMAGNWATAEAMLTEDFFVTEADTLPMAGVYRGRTGLQQLFTKVMSIASVKDLQIHQITAGGDSVVVLLDLVLDCTPEERAPIAEVFHFRDGLICEIKPYYFDPTTMHAAVKRKQASGG